MKKLLLIVSALFAFISFTYAQHYALFGTTYVGGAYGYGTIYMYDLTTGKDSVIVNFNNSGNGYEPLGNLVQNPNDSLLYGLTTYGGANGDGVLFSVNPYTGQDSNRVVLNGNNGYEPWQGGLTWYNNMYYGMIWAGGVHGTADSGVIFRFDPKTNNNTILHYFTGANGAEYYPWGTSLTPYSDGKMYAMTYNGGALDSGTIFRFDPVTGQDSVMVSLNGTTGNSPEEGTLILRPKDGSLYGVNSLGGSVDSGTFFNYNPATKVYIVIQEFSTPNGTVPAGSVLYVPSYDMFYGMTYFGGTFNKGVIFSYDPNTTQYKVVYNFDSIHGSHPDGNLILGASSNSAYGFTTNGGYKDSGVLFRFDLFSNQVTVLDSLNGHTGGQPGGSPILVNICPPVKAAMQPMQAAVCAGNDTSFTATVTSTQPVTYQWMVNTGSGYTNVSNGGVYSGATTPTLKITGATAAMNGYKYVLSATNSCGSVVNSDSVTLTVSYVTISGSHIGNHPTDTLTATGGVSYTWSTGGTNDTIIVHNDSLGTHIYTVTAVSSLGCTDTASFWVTVYPIGFATISATNSTTLYPNPASETLYLSFTTAATSVPAFIKVSDILGKEVMNRNITITNGQTSAFDVKSLANGIYFVEITSGKYSQVIKFVKE